MKHYPLTAGQTLFGIAPALRPALHGARPQNIVLRGVPGTGKTTAVRLLFAGVEETTTRVVPVLVVCLDDANWLLPEGALDGVLAPLLRMHEAWPGARTGVMPPAALDLVVERAMACADIRVGLDLIGRATKAAEEAGRRTVVAGDVFAAFALSKNLHVAVTVGALSGSERAVLGAVLVEGREEDGAAVAGRVYEWVCEEEKMGYTMFHERLKRLEALRLVDVQMVRRGRGRRREVGVREGVEEVLCGEGLSETTGRHAGVAEDQK